MGLLRGLVLLFLFGIPTLSWGLNSRVDDIRALKTNQASLLNSYLDLMESQKLIHQTSNALKKKGLLKRNGGLCSFTAQVNTIQSVSQYFQISKSKFLERPGYFEYEIVEEARAYMKDDPAYEGALLTDVEKYTEVVLEKYGLDQIISIDHTDKKSDIDPKKFKNYYWKMRILGLLSKNGQHGHTVVLLKADTKNNTFYISDPNYPNKVIKIPYEETPAGIKVSLTDDFPDFQPALIDEMLEVNVIQ